MYGPIKKNVRQCVRCEDEPAQKFSQTTFALGTYCLMEVMPRGNFDEMREQYMALVAKYGYRA